MRKEKQLLLDEIKEKLVNAKGMILVSYDKLTPTISWNLSSQLKKKESFFEVVKKRVFLKAAKEAEIDVDIKDLSGHVGIVLINDETIEATKEFYKFSEDNDTLFQVIKGKIDGKSYTSSEMKELSRLPSELEMKAMFLGLLEAPLSQTLSVMDNLLCSVMYCLENKEKEEVNRDNNS